MKQWYEKLFENFGQHYDKESFTKGTTGEVNFIEKEIHYNTRTKILDIGCGTGRHSIELAKRGYTVTGIDLSESMLNIAKEKASREELLIDFIQVDARKLSFRDEFDLAIMICEGAFPLMETDEMNFEILKHTSNALKSKGKFIFTTLNGLFPLFHSVKEFLENESVNDNASYEDHHFDLMTFRDYNTTSIIDDNNQKVELKCNERYYVPSEITWLLKSLHFVNIDIYGAKPGAFNRDDKLQTDDYEMLVIAEKN